MNISKYSKLFSFGTLYWAGLFVLLIYMFHDNVLSVDDIYYSFLADNTITLHRDFYYGTWLMHVQNVFMYYLPYKLGVNLQEWAQYFGAFIEASGMLILFIFYSKLFEFAQISKKMNLFLTSISFMLVFFLLNLLNFKDLLIYSGFFRFVIPSVLLVIWSYYLYKIFKFDDFGKVKLIVFLIFSVLVASSSEVAGVICIVSSFILIICSLLTKKECGEKFAVIFFAVFLGFAALLLTKGFQEHFTDKLQDQAFDLDTIAVNILPYLKACLKVLIPVNGFLFAVFLVFLFLNKKVQNSKDEMIFVSSLAASVIVFALSLVILGKTHYSGGYWIQHADIYVYFYFLYVEALALLSINLFNSIINKKFLLVCFYILLPLFFVSLIHLRISIENIKDYTYLRDKMMLHYMSESETEKIVLPYALYNNAFYNIISHVFVNFNAFLNLYSPEFTQHDKEFLEQYKDSMYINYYPIVFNFKPKNNNYPVEFVDGKSAMEMFTNNGGEYGEIQKHKYRFSDLEIKE